jgi:type IV pilus assembly protein PilB
MPRALALVYDFALAVLGLVAILLVLDDSIPSAKVLAYLPADAARLVVPLKARVGQVLGAFTAMLVARFFLLRTSDSGQVADAGSRHVAINFAQLDRDDPETMDRIRKGIQDHGQLPAVEMIDLMDEIIIAGAFLRASDVHIEPKGKTVRLAYRVDGILRDIAQFPKSLEHAMVNRLKIASRLDISKTDAPQDGRYEGKVAGKALNLRVSIFPTLHGEKAVIRILDSGRKVPRLEEFGIREEVLANFRRLLHNPQGLMLFTGPTGSGKTTLMYSSLREILEGEEAKRNIVTLEDPIEQELEDINQTQIDTKRGLTFALGLRTVLRQDPDIIMVGEIRDVETAKIALQAGQTGHMILSTIHANSSAAAFARLIDMGIEPFLLVSAMTGVVAQRLVRRICPNCPVRRVPPSVLLEQLGLPQDGGTAYFEGAGCSECNNTGFQGRMAIFELLKMNEQVADVVLRKGSTADIHRVAQTGGMLTLIEDGLAKVQEGHTSLVELMRVVQG